MPTSPSAPTKAAATRERILDTAAALFWRRSFHSVAVDELAAAAQVNKATIYRYFPDKASIAIAVARLNGERIEASVFAPAFEDQTNPAERLAAIYQCMIDALRSIYAEESDIFGCPLAGLTLELGREMPELRSETASIFAKVEHRLIMLAKDAIDEGTVADWAPQALGRVLLQILHGAFVSSRLAANPGPFVDAANASLALIGSDRRLPHQPGET